MNEVAQLLERLDRMEQNQQTFLKQLEIITDLIEQVLEEVEDQSNPYVAGLAGVAKLMKMSIATAYADKELQANLTPRNISAKKKLYLKEEVYQYIEGTKER